MTLTNNTKLQNTEFQADFTEQAAAEVIAEGALSLTLEGATPVVNGDWAYSATAEGRTGEVAVNSIDLDGAPGVIYSGQAGGAIRIKVAGLDILEGTSEPEATDSVAVAVFVNNDIVDFFDEGFVLEHDNETLAEFNIDTYIGNLQPLDVIRIALVGGTEETVDYDIDNAGTVNIV